MLWCMERILQLFKCQEVCSKSTAAFKIIELCVVELSGEPERYRR
jgi:hypothetical protein